MSISTQFEVTKSFWPFQGLLSEKQRKKKLEKLKLTTLAQLDDFKKDVESNMNSDDTVLNKIECCKNNIFQINNIIRTYNELCPKKKPIGKMAKVDFKYWKTNANAALNEDVCLKIASFLKYRSLYNWSLGSKLLRQSVQRNQCLAFRLIIFPFENYLIRLYRNASVHCGLLDSGERQEHIYILFHTIIETLKLSCEKTILKKEEVSRISAELFNVAKIVTDVRRIFLDRFLLIAIQLRLHAIQNKTISPKLLEIIDSASKSFRITLTPEIIQDIFSWPPEKDISLFTIALDKVMFQHMLVLVDNISELIRKN